MKTVRLTALFAAVPAIAHAASGRGMESGNMLGAVFQMLASLAVVIGIIYLIYYASNRWLKVIPSGRGRAGLIRVVETKYLAPKRSLMIVEVAGELLLLGNSSEGVNLIKKLESAEGFEQCDSEADPGATPEVFLRKFNRMLDNALTGLNAAMENGPSNNTPLSKKNGECR